jgi:hypothetical protein
MGFTMSLDTGFHLWRGMPSRSLEIGPPTTGAEAIHAAEGCCRRAAR